MKSKEADVMADARKWDVIKATDFSDIFGKVKNCESGQKFKDEAKKGWKEKAFPKGHRN